MKIRILLITVGILTVIAAVVGGVTLSRRRTAPAPDVPPSPTARASPRVPSAPTPPELLLPPAAPPAPATARGTFRPHLCPDAWGTQRDSDRDGLPDGVELLYRTDAARRDTDGDGFTDGAEVRNGYDPRRPGSARLDSDRDGLLDLDECRWKTDALHGDTDGDGFTDGAEVQNGFDPTIRGDGQGSDRLRATPPRGSRQGLVAPPPPPPAAAIPPVSRRELAVVAGGSNADVQTYLAAIERIRPPELSNEAVLARALSNALRGQPAELERIRENIRRYENALLRTPTPARALAHHQLLVSLARYVNDRLGAMVTFAADRQRVAAVATELQTILPSYVTRLQQLNTELQQFANP